MWNSWTNETGQAMTRSALITGASRGIGRAIALELAADGVDLIGLHYGQNLNAATVAGKEIAAHGSEPVLLQADLAKDTVNTAHQLANTFLDEVQVRTGRREFDVFVSNAGGGASQALAEIDETSYREVMDLNFTAPLFLLQALTPHIAANGRVVLVSSGDTRVASPSRLVYAAGKSALESLRLALAPMLGERGVTINAVLPGIIDTERNAGWLGDPSARERAAAMSVFGRIGTAEDVAALVRHLASPSASWTTGELVKVSGGARL